MAEHYVDSGSDRWRGGNKKGRVEKGLRGRDEEKERRRIL
jgi:hypothetical protein